MVDICLLPAIRGENGTPSQDTRTPKILAYELAAQV